MTTGRRAFEGESRASLIAAILRGEPRPLSELQPLSPPLLERILARGLAKDPEDRWQTARDLKRTIEWAGELEENRATASGSALGRKRALWPGLVLAAAALAAILVWNSDRSGPQSTVRMVVNLPETHQLLMIGAVPFDVSPDGSRIVFVGQPVTGGWGRLFLRELGDFESEPITGGIMSLAQPFFSPDGRSVGFVNDTLKRIYKVSLDGGVEVEVARIDRTPLGLSWTDDGRIVFGSTGSGLLQVSELGGEPELLTGLGAGENGHHLPRALPDGRGVLFTVFKGTQLYVAVLHAGESDHRELIEGSGASYVPSGHLVFHGRGEQLFAVPFDLDELEITGTPVPIADSVRDPSSFAVGRDGTLVYTVGTALDTVGWVDRDGTFTPVLETRYHALRLSPDGERLAADDEGGGRIWNHDLSRETRVLVAEAPRSLIPLWSPDGSEIAYTSGEGNIFVKAADGTGEPRPLVERENSQWALSWTPDGQFLAVTDHSPFRGRDVIVLPGDGGEPILVATTPAQENAAAFSPDGKWIAYQSDETGRAEIYVQPFPGPGRRELISSNGGKAPVWSRDGRELFYREGAAVMAVEVST